jgi:hypothetical protein
MLLQKVESTQRLAELMYAFVEQRGASITTRELISTFTRNLFREDDVRAGLVSLLDPEFDGRLVMLKDGTLSIWESQ